MPLQVGIDPEFAILDESIAGSLRDEAVRSALRLLLAARDPDLIELGTDYGLRQVREALGRLASVRGTADLDDWSQLAPEAIVEHWRARYADRLWPAVRDRVLPSVRHCRQVLEALDTTHPKIHEQPPGIARRPESPGPRRGRLLRPADRRAGGALARRRLAPKRLLAVGGHLRGRQGRNRRAPRSHQNTRQAGTGLGRGGRARRGQPEPAVRPAGAGGPSRARTAQARVGAGSTSTTSW